MSPKEESKSRGVKQEQSRGLKYNAIGAERIYFPLRTLGGLQCHLGMNLLMLGGNLSSPSEEGRGKERE